MTLMADTVRIELYDPDGNMETGTNCLNCTHVQIDHQLVKSGSYTIVVKDESGTHTGDYKPRIQQNSGASEFTFNTHHFKPGCFQYR